ncbi:MAG TPA: ADOP family duplicated permease [Acidobacteriota bacterium]|nr:ADOP family duplicated permease [Acidobacteriota bacterium]
MQHLFSDFRHGLRWFRRHSGFALGAAATLALGIAAATAAFAAVDAVLWRPLPYQDSRQLVAVFESDLTWGGARNPTSPANFVSWSESSQALGQWTAAHPWEPVLTGRGPAQPLQGLKATAQLFDLLGVEAALGRPYDPQTVGQDARVVVLSHGLWSDLFAADPQVLGTSMRLDGEDYRIAAVMPEGFAFPPFWARGARFWVPLPLSPQERARRGARFLRTFARLREGHTIEEARREMDALGDRLRREFPHDNRNIEVVVESLQEPVVENVRPALTALAGAVALILLIAAANTTALLLVKGAARRQELALRRSLGATGRRLLRQLLCESLLIALAAGLAGTVLGLAGGGLLLGYAPDLPRLGEIGLSWRSVLFAAVLSLLCGLLLGGLSALQAANRSRLSGMRGTTISRRQSRFQGGLVAAQIALALALVAGAGALLQSFANLLHLDPGLKADGLLCLQLSFPPRLGGEEPGAADRQRALMEEVAQALSGQPGVESTGFINHLHIGGDLWGMGLFPSPARGADEEEIRASVRVATPSFFTASRLTPLRGRLFDGSERPDGRRLAVVNRALARSLGGPEQAVGRRLRLGDHNDDPVVEVIGVVADVPQYDLTREVRPEIYLPYAHNPYSWFAKTWLLARIPSARPEEAAPAVRARLQEVDPNLAVGTVRSFRGLMSDNITTPRFLALLLSCLSGLALVLAMAGLYGLLAYSEGRRRRETGLRMALGATPSRILKGVMGKSLLLAGVGSLAGLLLAWLLAGYLRGVLVGVEPFSASTLLPAAATLLVCALLASLRPAWRASRVDPARTLSEES